jgi:hypothetical protein
LASKKIQPWAMGLISCVIGLIGLILPVTLTNESGVLVGTWLWGLVWGTYGGVSVSLTAYDPIGITCTFIILVAGIIPLLTIYAAHNRGSSKGFAILWILCGIAIAGAFLAYMILQIDVFIITDLHLGTYFFFFGGGLLTLSGATLFSKGSSASGGGSAIHSGDRKYTCVNCGFKTKKLPFQPIECPKCGGVVIQSI